MKIALLGYGKMGHMIEAIALERGHEIVLKIDASNLHELTKENLQKADAAIEFSVPDSAVANMKLCFEAGVPIVVGTTGWYGQLDEVKKRCNDKNAALVYASNFSVGVNVLFSLNELLAKWMNRFDEYKPSITEVHHTQKLDAPSGTAITLAEGVLSGLDKINKWEKYPVEDKGDTSEGVMPVYYAREDNVPGIHTVTYTSDIDKVELHHEAFNRKGFALGSVLAAEFLKGKKGVYTARDIFNFDTE